MNYISLNNANLKVSFKEALMQGIAADGSLFIPATLPVLPDRFLHSLATHSLFDIANTILAPFIDDIPKSDLEAIIKKTFHFPIPLVHLDEQIYLLELFHGPTLAFKDVGARFIAEVLAYFLKNEQKKITLLVATSGDTGSAVARGFYQVPYIDVYILYPSQKVSPLQEKQMTTLGGNIHAIEVQGTFDDCQQLVKSSLKDETLQKALHLTTANSINIGRLLPQIVYYFFGIAELQKAHPHVSPTVVVPSGNFGNLTAAAYARALGAPIEHLVAATNANAVVPNYLKTGILKSQKTQHTLSNAMDVGQPNNFVRLQALFDNQYEKIKSNVTGISITDAETLAQIQQTFKQNHYILDPHTAVGVAAAFQLRNKLKPMIVAATAHPAKFPEVIQTALNQAIPVPEALRIVMSKPKMSTLMKNDFQAWKAFLLS